MDLALNKKFFNACVNGEIAKVLGMIDLDGVDLNLVDAEQNKTSLDAIVLSKLDVDKKITIINLLLAKGAIASSSFKRFAVESDSIPLLASLHGNGQLSVDDLMEIAIEEESWRAADFLLAKGGKFSATSHLDDTVVGAALQLDPGRVSRKIWAPGSARQAIFALHLCEERKRELEQRVEGFDLTPQIAFVDTLQKQKEGKELRIAQLTEQIDAMMKKMQELKEERITGLDDLKVLYDKLKMEECELGRRKMGFERDSTRLAACKGIIECLDTHKNGSLKSFSEESEDRWKQAETKFEESL
ncbi:MAG: hypothetical protein US13_C0001G0126 [candidate division TM6 bacterium GW2011_GWE2_36_25]|nr:MAG: hypothetical protein US03_C0001G0078 [candidate division TM6 bacterium GW2011_GWF2_36_131]KKQ03786.1 MAG: hypothetical protein US13_C0001G0126 [candidate division TM6 bacterium GW2011_GWE2_36_25]KKQ19932.1 MAG: hypothetical protein US32_C0003G0049 [candidate division TM6 bacterium GW2011_GWA2_36_9]